MSAKRREPTRRSFIGATIFMFCGLAFMTWIFAAPWVDASDQQWMRCEVVDAKATQGNRHATVPWYVVVDTSDCGTVTYRVGTNQDNVRGVAETFEPGPYEFKFGKLSQREVEGWTLFDNVADAKDFRSLPADHLATMREATSSIVGQAEFQDQPMGADE